MPRHAPTRPDTPQHAPTRPTPPHTRPRPRARPSPASAFCCFSIFSRRPSNESILVLICVSSFLIVCNSSDFTGGGTRDRKGQSEVPRLAQLPSRTARSSRGGVTPAPPRDVRLAAPRGFRRPRPRVTRPFLRAVSGRRRLCSLEGPRGLAVSRKRAVATGSRLGAREGGPHSSGRRPARGIRLSATTITKKRA